MHPKALETLGDASAAYQDVAPDTLSTATAAFKEDGSLGHYDEGWIGDAINASDLRASGGTAEFELMQFKECWGDQNEEFTDEEDSDHDSHDGKRDDNNDEDDDDDDNEDGKSPDDVCHSPNDHDHESGGEDYSIEDAPASETHIFEAEGEDHVMEDAPVYGSDRSEGANNSETAKIKIRHPQRTQIKLWTSDIKMDLLFFMSPGMWQSEPVIRTGDVIYIGNGGNLMKEIKVKCLNCIFTVPIDSPFTDISI